MCFPKGYSSLQLARSLEGMARVPSKLGSLTLWLLVQFPQGESPGAWRVRRQEVFIPSLPPLMTQVGKDSLPQAGVVTVSHLNSPQGASPLLRLPFSLPKSLQTIPFPFSLQLALGFVLVPAGTPAGAWPNSPSPWGALVKWSRGRSHGIC